jgi:hypothetical protein
MENLFSRIGTEKPRITGQKCNDNLGHRPQRDDKNRYFQTKNKSFPAKTA